MRQAVSIIAAQLSSFSARLNLVCWRVGVAFLLIMLAAVALQVVARYVFFSPPAWTEELARYAMVWAGFLGATVSFYKFADPVIVTPEPGSRRKQIMNEVLRSFAAIIFLAPVVLWSPTIIGHHMLRDTESLNLTSGYVLLIVPLFSIVILIHVVARLLSTAAGQSETDTPEIA